MMQVGMLMLADAAAAATADVADAVNTADALGTGDAAGAEKNKNKKCLEKR